MGERRQRCIDRTGRFGLNWTIARVDGVDPDRARATKQARCDVGRGAIRDDVEPPSGNRAPRGVSRVPRAVKAGRSSHLDTVKGEDASVRADTSSAGRGSARPDPSSALLIAGGWSKRRVSPSGRRIREESRRPAHAGAATAALSATAAIFDCYASVW